MIKLILKLLIKAMNTAGKLDASVKADILQLPNNYVIKFNVLPKNINVLCKIENGKIFRIKEADNVDLTLEFKDKKSALKAMFAVFSVASAFAEHRIKVYGNLNNAVVLIRIINSVICYLYPAIITNRLYKPKPEINANKIKFYWILIFGRRK